MKIKYIQLNCEYASNKIEWKFVFNSSSVNLFRCWQLFLNSNHSIVNVLSEISVGFGVFMCFPSSFFLNSKSFIACVQFRLWIYKWIPVMAIISFSFCVCEIINMLTCNSFERVNVSVHTAHTHRILYENFNKVKRSKLFCFEN